MIDLVTAIAVLVMILDPDSPDQERSPGGGLPFSPAFLFGER